MDPLSAIASVAGIISAASQAITVLKPFVTANKDAPKIATEVLSEVLAVKTRVLSELSKAGIVQDVKFDSLRPVMSLPDSLSPDMPEIEEFVSKERAYLARLECLLRLEDQIRSHTGAFAIAAYSLFLQARVLVDTQRRLLLRLEGLALQPYNSRTWSGVFRDWSSMASESYSRFVAGEKHAKAALLLAMNAENVPDKLQALIGDALTVIPLPSQRLGEYRVFIEELLQHDDDSQMEKALKCLAEVVEGICVAKAEQELHDAKTDLVTLLDQGSQAFVKSLGNILLFEDNAIIEAFDCDDRMTAKARSSSTYRVALTKLYLFEDALLYMTPAGQPSNSRLNDQLRPSPTHERYRQAPQLIVAKVQVIRTLEELEPAARRGPKRFKISWSFSSSEDMPYGCSAVVTVPTDAQHEKWMGELKRLRSFAREMSSQSQAQARHEKAKTLTYLREYNIAVMGGAGVNKSAFTMNFLTSKFLGEYNDGDRSSIECVIDDQIARVNVLNTAGAEEYSAMMEHSMKTNEGFLLVYSVTSRYSFEEISTYQRQILRVKDKDFYPMILVGDNCGQETGRDVSTIEGTALAQSLGCPFVETDGSTGLNVEKAFFDLVRAIRKYNGSYDY
ncbi:ras family-domain-containing protein [Apodospora peruviana]|uniref:Ras family-domain-containing protein n=1 Tax=Apodospora peruviana TaxID=516989 RepID=A0AAE0M4T3_9PEZI|nr:ras family-domain-containing protein [Apodospora peruviana]